MLYLKCPSCHELLGNRQIIYDTILKDIMDSDMNEETKNTKKKELIKNMNLQRYCCKMRLMTYSKLIEIIK
jgi:DNA-directed RNA polymerase subunit N (RpoN/RPB10)